jgi:hypothetical protein
MAEIRAYFAVREDNACDVRERRETGRTDEEKAEDRESSDVGEFDNGERRNFPARSELHSHGETAYRRQTREFAALAGGMPLAP